MTPRVIPANGVDFAYLEIGQGPLVLCMHGFPDTAWSFVPLLEHLGAAGYRAVAPFMRGYLPSGLAPDGDYRVITLGRDALSLIEALGAQRAILVGHDWGAVATYIAAALAPERVERMVTAAVPHVRRFLPWPNLRQLRRSRYMGFFQLPGIPERRIVADDFRWLRALIREWSPGWNFSEEEFGCLKAVFSDSTRLSAALAYYRAMPRNLTDRATWELLFTPIKVAARMIRGANDGCIGPEMFEGQERLFAGSFELITLQRAGHFMHCEQTEAFAQLVLEFIM
jgi:pimeloyl-ACP methyl ester carboxylesterase